MQSGIFQHFLLSPPDVAEKGLIATFTLRADIEVFDLSGTVYSKLGIYE